MDCGQNKEFPTVKADGTESKFYALKVNKDFLVTLFGMVNDVVT